ncbi:MAG: DUF2478 domain-containing protein [Maritimibacter sp.]
MSKIATLLMPGRGDTDLMLEHFAQQASAQGHVIRGTVQINTESKPDHPCDMDVKVLPDGPVVRISQSLGKNAKGCRLDPSALEVAVAAVASSINDPVDLLIINKFGKHEAEGRGFRDVIAEAVARDIPIIVGLNKLNAGAFEAFAGAYAEPCAPNLAALTEWFEQARRNSPEPA